MQTAISRDCYFDNLKFILIALVVTGHFLEPLSSSSPLARTLYHFIYFFHIPLFVFVTGYFSKKLDKISHLLVLYLVFEVLYTLLDFCLNNRMELRFTFFSPYWVTWYLLAVILWKIALPYFLRFRYPVATAAVLALLAGYASQDFGYKLSAMRAINFFPYFLAGYLVKKEHLQFLFRRSVKLISSLMLVTACYLLYRYGGGLKSEWLWGSYSYADIGHTEWFAGIYRLGVSAVSILLSLSVLSIVPHGISRLSDYGARTMYPFLLHGFLVKCAVYLGLYGSIGTGAGILLLIPLAYTVTVVLSMKWIEGPMRWIFRPRLSFLFKTRYDQQNKPAA